MRKITLSFVLGIFLLAPSAASALSLDDIAAQITSIRASIQKMQSQTVAQVEPAVSSNYACAVVPSTSLQLHDISSNVAVLQKILNISPDTQVTATGDGSPGMETKKFGPLTYQAVIKFQEKYASDILTPAGLTSGSGFVGPKTLAKMSEICNVLFSDVTSTDVSLASISSADLAARAYNRNFFKNYRATPSKPVVPTPPPAPVATTTPAPVPTPPSVGSASGMQWGAYVGDGSSDLSNLEALTGKPVNIMATFEGWSDSFPSVYSSTIGAKGKTLVIFWEPAFGYDTIIGGSKDSYIKQFAAAAKSYGYPVILVPFDEMNLNEEAWGYGQNGNTAAKFQTAWKHIHDLFSGVTNVKFALAYNNVSIPNVSGNKFADYYPGDNYVDYMGVDGFNFGNPWQSFGQVFDAAMSTLSTYNKPIYIFSVGSAAGSQKAAWVTEGLGSHIKTYTRLSGWIWFNQNGEADWRVNSDSATLQAFKSILP